MRKWMFTCAVVALVGLSTELASAQELIQAPTTEIVSPARRGLFRRGRERREVVVVAQPVTMTKVSAPMPSPIQQAQAVEAPKIVTMPMATTMTQPQEVVEVRRGLFGRGRRQVMVVNQPVVTPMPVPTPSPIQQAQGTEASKSLTPPMTTTMTQPQVIEVRRGLFGRVRSR